MSEKHYKVSESILTDIADAIRLQKKSEKKYKATDFAKIIRGMYTLPSGLAETDASFSTNVMIAIGILPTIYASTAGGSVYLASTLTAAGTIPDYESGAGLTAVNIASTTSAAGVLTE